MTSQIRLTELEAPSADTPTRLAEAAPRVVVVGDALLDGWWHGTTHRLCREAPAPVVELDDRVEAPGGAANTALNAASLGAHVQFLGVVGDDVDGQHLQARLVAGGVDCSGLIVAPGFATTTKTRVVAGDQIIARLDVLSQDPPVSARRALADRVRDVVSAVDAVVVCDYGLGTLDGEVRDELLAVLAPADSNSRRPLVVVDAHEPERWRELRPDLATPNEEEALRMVGGISSTSGADRVDVMRAHREELLDSCGARCVVVTMDRDGSLALPGPDFSLGQTVGQDDRGGAIPEHRTWARPVADRQASGAGDTFVAALTVGMAAGLPAPTAFNLAQAAADVAVHRPGTALCTTADLQAYLGSLASAVMDLDVLERRVEQYRAEGRRVVLTNGCFDVLHRGHTRYLEQARQLGDVLIVAVNDDESVRRLKGPGRPINTAADRAAVLAALSAVDHVAIFSSDTAVDVVRRLRPDVYAKGGDYTADMLAERSAVEAYGGTVVILDYVRNYSTTGVVTRIRDMDGEAPNRLVRSGDQP